MGASIFFTATTAMMRAFRQGSLQHISGKYLQNVSGK
jgi:hypothetical protein